ncbi:ras-related protein Rab-39B-like protein, partial [Dinothrombium tinctorium]
KMIEPPFHYQFRLILIGDSTVGKSTLLKVFTEGSFSETSDPTVGVDFFAKIIDIKNNVKIKLQLWDTAGQEKFRSITRSYYRNSVGALLLYDVTRRSSFDHLVDWLFEARRHIEPSGAVYQVVACKSDLELEREITREEGEAFADFHNIKFIETSAKTGQNVELAFRMIAEQIYDKLKAGKFELRDDWDGVKVGHFGPNSLLAQSLGSSRFPNGHLLDTSLSRIAADQSESKWCC